MTNTAKTDGGIPNPGDVHRGVAGGVAGGVVALALGILLAMLGLGGIIGGVAVAAVFAHQGPDGYLSSPVRDFSTTSYALTSPPARIGTDKLPLALGSLRLSAASTSSGGQVFIGIGPKSDVENYLSGVHVSQITGVETSPFRVQYSDVPGTAAATPPGDQSFWAESASGPGIQQLTMDLRSGDWVVVIMNSDAGAGVTVHLQAAVHSPLFGALTPALWIGGAVLLLIGASLIAIGAIVLGRRTPAPIAEGSAFPASGVLAAQRNPVRLSGQLDPQLSRGLWLVKWLLAVPHVVILAFLWFAVFVTTVISGVAVLFTGRYPRPLFVFAVGVLRWNWRVTFYAYSALATDRYPPFTLASTNYPADLDIDYPQHLSHGLVLVKGWLLAIPHLIIVGIFTSTVWLTWTGIDTWTSDNDRSTGISLLGILVLVAAVMLMFTGRYPRTVFDLVMGINRWIYRVAAYVLLLRDEYPPFRLDQGPLYPAEAGTPTGGPAAGQRGNPDPPMS